MKGDLIVIRECGKDIDFIVDEDGLADGKAFAKAMKLSRKSAHMIDVVNVTKSLGLNRIYLGNVLYEKQNPNREYYQGAKHLLPVEKCCINIAHVYQKIY